MRCALWRPPGRGHDGRAPAGPHATRGAEQLVRPIEGLGLHVLGEANRDRTGIGRVAQYPHGTQKGIGKLFRPAHPVEKTRDRAEGVVHRDVSVARVLELLKYGVGDTGGEDVATGAAGLGAG